jgi:hypothetical protein
MASLQKYANILIALDGGILLEAQSVDVSRDTKGQIIETMAKGMAGVSPGAAFATANIKNAVPMPGIEFNMDKHVTSTGVPNVVELTLFIGSGQVLTTKGFIMKDTVSGATNSPTGYSFEFTGQFAAMG